LRRLPRRRVDLIASHQGRKVCYPLGRRYRVTPKHHPSDNNHCEKNVTKLHGARPPLMMKYLSRLTAADRVLRSVLTPFHRCRLPPIASPAAHPRTVQDRCLLYITPSRPESDAYTL